MTLDQMLTEYRNLSKCVLELERTTLRVHGLSFVGLMTLHTLQECAGGISMGDLCERLGRDTSTMTVIVDRLEEAGYVVRVRSIADRRRINISLTDAGDNALRAVKRVA